MDQNRVKTAEEPYDFRQYDQIWQRVAPSLSPYPGGAASNGQAPGNGGMAGRSGPMARQETPTPPSVPSTPAPPPVPSAPSTPEGDLPGAIENPCCMGTAARDDLEVVEGFIEVELSDRRYYQAFGLQAPASARQTARQLACSAEDHVRRLLAAYYLITGVCYRPSVSCDRVYVGAWCPALRERYHGETCGWMNYVRAAEGTTDPCLGRLFRELGAGALHRAELLSGLLEQALGGTCGNRRTGV